MYNCLDGTRLLISSEFLVQCSNWISLMNMSVKLLLFTWNVINFGINNLFSSNINFFLILSWIEFKVQWINPRIMTYMY